VRWSIKIILIAVFVGAVAVVLILLFGESGKGEIEKLIKEALAAAKRGEAEKCISFIAKDYNFNNVKYERICHTIRAYIKPGLYRDIKIIKKNISVLGESATCDITVSVESSTSLYRKFNVGFTIHLKKRGGRWWVFGIEAEREF
jgi:hypothetical protein